VEAICLQGRTLTGDDLALVRALIAQHPEWHRTALSLHLCQLWNWRNGAGQLKDMAARTLLLKLQARGLIELPPPRSRTARPGAKPPPLCQPEWLPPEPLSVAGPLAWLQPVRLELAHTPELRRRVVGLLAQYHYRGFHGPVGENVQYLARDVRGGELAVMVFGAAAWKVAVRDEFIGWSVPQRQQHLSRVANQQRFLILPWVRVPHLASHLLALATQRLSADWQARYGHPVWLVETFVQVERFAGTAYKAAGWLELGLTTGRTRQDSQRTLTTPRKSVWVRPLHRAFRQWLTNL
jgi:Domain of unknown function (DUF4338)